MPTRRLVIPTLALGFLVAVPTAANAQTKMLLSGRMKQYCCDFPAVNIGGPPNLGWPQDYDWAAYYGVTPMNPKAFAGGMVRIYPTLVTAKGASNKTLHLRTFRWGAKTKHFIPDHPALDLKTLSGTHQHYNADGSWSFGGSPGTFSFCPVDEGPAPGG